MKNKEVEQHGSYQQVRLGLKNYRVHIPYAAARGIAHSEPTYTTPRLQEEARASFKILK